MSAVISLDGTPCRSKTLPSRKVIFVESCPVEVSKSAGAIPARATVLASLSTPTSKSLTVDIFIPSGAAPVTENRSEPEPPESVLIPEPPSKTSRPAPPSKTSSPEAPESTSSPSLPRARSSPGPA